ERERQGVVGKHWGKEGVETRLKGLGLNLPSEQVEEITARVKALADRQKFVYDDDLLAMAEHAVEQRAQLVRYQVVAGNHILPTATVEVEGDGERRSPSAVGNGPLAAAPKATDAALGPELTLLHLPTRAGEGGGEEGQGRGRGGDRARAARGPGDGGPGREHGLHRGVAQGVFVGRRRSPPGARGGRVRLVPAAGSRPRAWSFKQGGEK